MTAPSPDSEERETPLGRDDELAVQAALERTWARDGRSPLNCFLARDGDLAGEMSAWVKCCEACHKEYRPERTGGTVVVNGLTLCCAWYCELGEPEFDEAAR